MSAHTDGRPAQIHLCRRTNIEAVSSSYDSQLSSSDSWTPYLELTAVSPALTPLCRLICSMAGASSLETRARSVGVGCPATATKCRFGMLSFGMLITNKSAIGLEGRTRRRSRRSTTETHASWSIYFCFLPFENTVNCENTINCENISYIIYHIAESGRARTRLQAQLQDDLDPETERREAFDQLLLANVPTKVLLATRFVSTNLVSNPCKLVME